jgi:phenylacetate-CoA ligase
MAQAIFPTVVSGATAQVQYLERQFAALEKAPPEQQQGLRNKQIGVLIAHARRHSAFWEERLRPFGGRFQFDDLPVLTRADLLAHGDAMLCRTAAPGGAGTVAARSAGRTGAPVQVMRTTPLFGLLRSAQYMRMHAWHGLDARQDVAAIGGRSDGVAPNPWGAALAELYGASRCHVRNGLQHGPDELWEWLSGQAAPYLFTSPSMALQMARRALAAPGKALRLRAVLTDGEVVTAEHRGAVRQAFGAAIVDRYACEEAGWLAFQCPRHDHYHTLPGVCHVEVVDAAGRAVAPGQEGRVLATPLHGYAQPLFRYDTGDRAVAGGACDCGITLPVIARIVGRG